MITSFPLSYNKVWLYLLVLKHSINFTKVNKDMYYMYTNWTIYMLFCQKKKYFRNHLYLGLWTCWDNTWTFLASQSRAQYDNTEHLLGHLHLSVLLTSGQLSNLLLIDTVVQQWLLYPDRYCIAVGLSFESPSMCTICKTEYQYYSLICT